MQENSGPPSPREPASALAHTAVLACATRLLASQLRNIETALSQAFSTIAQQMGAERVYVFAFSEDGQRFSCLQDHCVEGVPSIKASIQDVPLGSFPWSMSQLKADQVVQAREASDLPSEAAAERNAMETAPMSSFLSIPMQTQAGCMGALGLDWVSRRGEWNAADISNLRFLAQMLALVFERERLNVQSWQAEDRLRSFIAGSNDPVCCFEIPGGVSTDLSAADQFMQFRQRALVAECNTRFADLCHTTREAAVYGRRLTETHPELVHGLQGLFAAMVENGYHLNGAELALTAPEGGPLQFVARLFGILDGGTLVRLWGTFQDVTQQRQAEKERQTLEAQLRQSQRLESIGLLAGGVAHDFNNMLVAVLNYAELALRTVNTNPIAAAEDLRAIIKAAERAAALTRQLLAFSRQQPMRKQGINLNELIRDLMRLLRRVIHESIDLDFVPGHALGTITGDPGQLEQVLLNLVVNANDAIEDIGRITLETENVVLNGNYIKTHPWARPGRYVLLSVSDTGKGMTDEVRERAFEPFFSTKGPERGSGLGLSTAYGIVKQHDGMIHVYSEPGTGTRFKIYLPIVERAASTVSGRLEAHVKGGSETILIAEDNDMVRQVLTALLERAGYKVLAAKDGGEATQLFDQHAPTIHLALLDAVMPVMSGRAVFHHIHAKTPQLPVLFASGYTSGVFPEEFLREHHGRLIEKPYDSDTLLRRVREALDAAKGAVG